MNNLNEIEFQVKAFEEELHCSVSKVIKAIFTKNPKLQSYKISEFGLTNQYAFTFNEEQLRRLYSFGTPVSFNPDEPKEPDDQTKSLLISANLTNRELAHISKDFRELPIDLGKLIAARGLTKREDYL